MSAARNSHLTSATEQINALGALLVALGLMFAPVAIAEADDATTPAPAEQSDPGGQAAPVSAADDASGNAETATQATPPADATGSGTADSAQSGTPDSQAATGTGEAAAAAETDADADAEDSPAADAGASGPAQADAAVAGVPTAAERRYLEEVAALESRGDAYDPALSQHLLGLGIAYQQDGKHQQAIDTLNRAAHITRVNEGLYSPSDIPILELLIESHSALGEWEQVGNRYDQMFRIHRRNFGATDERLLPVLEKLSAWHMRAYLNDLGEQPLNHLVAARNLYESSENIMNANYGPHDPRLAETLRHRALVSYYLAVYRPPDNASEFSFGTTGSDYTPAPAYLISSFSEGRDALARVVEIRRQDPASSVLDRSRAVAELGDWHQLLDRRQTALEWYRQAYAEGAQAGEQSTQILDDVFGRPVALPVMPGELAASPASTGGEPAYILVSFDVNAQGRAGDFEVREAVPAPSDASVSRLKKQLRATRFRPRFASGEPVETADLLYRYLYQP